jgi:tetratricopeptide (TPR) repeat protein
MKNLSACVLIFLTCCLSVTACHKQRSHEELVQLSGELAQQGEFEKAGRLAHQALEAARETYPEDSPGLIGPLNDVAALFTALGRYAAAESLYVELLHMDERRLGREHIIVARDLNNLGATYRAQGRYKQAEPLFQRSVEICEKALGSHHPDVLNPLFNLAELYETQQIPDKIAAVYERILTIYEEIMGPDHPDLAPILEDMADFYSSADMRERATELTARAEQIRAGQSSGQTPAQP